MKRMTQLVGVGCAAVLCLSAWGYEWPAESSGDIVFGSPDAPIDGGEVVAPENAAVTSFTAYLKEGETLNVTGGPVALADGAAITNTLNAKVSFAADVAAAGAFEIGMPLELVTKTDAYCDSRTGKILFEGLDLDDYAVYDGGLIGSSQSVSQGLFVCQEERSPGRYEFQLQYDFGAEYQLRIAAKVRLVQEGADVRGYVLWCKYAWYMPNVLGYEHYGLGDDFEAIDPDWLGSYNIALAPDQSHLGLASLTLVRRQTRADAGVAFAGKLTGSGTIAVAKQARAILPYTCLPFDGRFVNNLSLAGDLCVGGIGCNITLANAVEWKGGRLVLDDMAFGGEPVVDVYTTLTADQLATYNAWGKITGLLPNAKTG